MKRNYQIGIGNISIDENAKRNVMDVLNSSRLSYGDYSRQFETEMAKIHDRKYAIFLNSGTSALHIALQVLKDKYGWEDNDEVLVPAVTFVATSNIVLHNRLKPIFVDVEKDFYCIDPKKVEEKITKKTRAIIPVHLFGQSSEMVKIIEIAKKYHLKIIEDSCEAMFVEYMSRPVGSMGDISCYSTYATHLITTGVGGLAMTNDDDLAIRLKSCANHGRDGIYLSIDDDKGKNKKDLFNIVERRFSFIHLGHSFRLTEMEAAIGVAQLKNWRSIIKKRQSNAKYLTANLSKWSKYMQLPKIRDGATHAFMLYPILILDRKISRKNLTEYLEINGIETRYLMPLLNQPIYVKLFGNLENLYPVARNINKNGFLIGCHQDLKKEELDHVIGVFNSYFSRI
ncbi:MAG: DegT/DnrJ/EryC1/StrS family aminotransferase [Candidatus Curtissbacteria bacterium]|nr:DegT/DnrJ/EryC1/StrS family aminotransferase [Candidatus Curtissbacteria bacterium]